MTRLLLFLALAPLVNADETPLKPDPNSDFYKAPDENIDFPGCFSDLAKADRNGDGVVKKDEYLGFIQMYSKRLCVENPFLTLQQRIAFNTIACGCRAEEGADVDCCIKENAQIRTAGALNPSRTGEQNAYLTSACRITDETLPDPQCPPVDDTRDTGPIPPVIPGVLSSDDGFPKEALWGLIAGALLLLLLCCCCVGIFRKRRQKQLEEEEEHAMAGKGLPGDAGSAVPEQSPATAGAPGSFAAGSVPRGTDDDDSDYDDEGRKRVGGGPLGGADEEDGRKRYGAGRLPPPEKDPKGHKLRPIEKEEEEDPDWDHPGRQIDYPKDKDDMSAGHVDHYEPDGGVYLPEREGKKPVDINLKWERGTPYDPDEVDPRKHRIQAGLGEGEVWDKLGEQDDDDSRKGAPQSDVFDWVVQSALGVLDKSDEAAQK